MTEQGWPTCEDPETMVEFVSTQVSDRKLRLFGCACCRRIWHILTDEQSRREVEVAELYADGKASHEEMRKAARAAGLAKRFSSLGSPLAAADAASEATWGPDEFGADYHLCLLLYNAFFAAGEAKSESIAQCILLREVVGNPFRRLDPDPRWAAWSDGTAVKVAQGIYDDRAFDRMPILADALEEAGCDNRDILDHCRSLGPHVRGCWVVDLILGKE